jgi:hypothetical protein
MQRFQVLLILLAGSDGFQLTPAAPTARGAVLSVHHAPALLPSLQHRAGKPSMALSRSVGLMVDAFGLSLKLAWRAAAVAVVLKCAQLIMCRVARARRVLKLKRAEAAAERAATVAATEAPEEGDRNNRLSVLREAYKKREGEAPQTAAIVEASETEAAQEIAAAVVAEQEAETEIVEPESVEPEPTPVREETLAERKPNTAAVSKAAAFNTAAINKAEEEAEEEKAGGFLLGTGEALPHIHRTPPTAGACHTLADTQPVSYVCAPVPPQTSRRRL